MSTTVEAVLDRINTIVASAPFRYERAVDPFNDDLQPNQVRDQSFRVGMRLEETEGVLGFHQTERWLVTIGLIRKHQADPHGAHRQLQVDVSSLTAALCREDQTAEFTFEEDEFRADLQIPEDTDNFVVMELSGVANFERAL